MSTREQCAVQLNYLQVLITKTVGQRLQVELWGPLAGRLVPEWRRMLQRDVGRRWKSQNIFFGFSKLLLWTRRIWNYEQVALHNKTIYFSWVSSYNARGCRVAVRNGCETCFRLRQLTQLWRELTGFLFVLPLFPCFDITTSARRWRWRIWSMISNTLQINGSRYKIVSPRELCRCMVFSRDPNSRKVPQHFCEGSVLYSTQLRFHKSSVQYGDITLRCTFCFASRMWRR